jgi:hypothetical protein
MANIRFSTDSLSWSTATINQIPDILGSTSWVSSQLSAAQQVNNITYANGIIGAITNNSLFLSSTKTVDADGTFNTIYNKLGIDWTTQTSNFGSTNILSVAYGNGLWVAGGAYGQIRTSTNGVTWTTQTSNLSNDFNGQINSIAYGNGLWIAGGLSGQLRTSTNGVTWTTQT